MQHLHQEHQSPLFWVVTFVVNSHSSLLNILRLDAPFTPVALANHKLSSTEFRSKKQVLNCIAEAHSIQARCGDLWDEAQGHCGNLKILAGAPLSCPKLAQNSTGSPQPKPTHCRVSFFSVISLQPTPPLNVQDYFVSATCMRAYASGKLTILNWAKDKGSSHLPLYHSAPTGPTAYGVASLRMYSRQLPTSSSPPPHHS
ncbi:hypothetical protein DFH27DRAFT_249530 [Peziza echinospora]|nr:hypothetical protein DFH27DRAFT_249530 [Peziza echinospora]